MYGRDFQDGLQRLLHIHLCQLLGIVALLLGSLAESHMEGIKGTTENISLMVVCDGDVS